MTSFILLCMKKSDFFKFSVGLALGLVLAVLVAFNSLLIWVANGPRSLEKLTPYLEEAFSASDGSYHIKIKDTWLIWDGWEHPIDIRVKDVSVLTADGEVFSTFPEVSLGLDLPSLLIAKIYPTSISIDKPIISLLQNADKRISFGVGEAGADKPTAPLAALLEPLINPKSKSSLNKLRLVEIIGANVSVGSAEKGVFFTAPNSNFIMRREARGKLVLNVNSAIHYGDYSSAIRGLFTFNRRSKTLEGSLNFAKLQPGVLADLFGNQPYLSALRLPLTGKSNFTFDEKGELKTAGFAIDGGKGSIESDELEGTLKVNSMHVSGKAEDYLKHITITQAVIDFDGMAFNATGKAEIMDGDAALAGSASLSNIPSDMVAHFWPKKLAPLTRDWVVGNITGGGIPKASVVFDIKHGDLKKPLLPQEAVHATVELKDTKIRYLPGHPELRNVNGTVKVDGLSLDAAIQSANALEGTKLSNGRVFIADLNPDNPWIELSLDADASAKDVVTLLGFPHLEHAAHLNLFPAKASGRTVASAKLGFYFFDKPDGEMTYELQATLANVTHPAFMKKFDLENINGKMSIDKKGIVFAGGGVVNGAAISGGDIRYMFKPEAGVDTFIKAKASANAAALQRFGYQLPDIWDGTLGIDLDAKLGTNIENISATVDLVNASVSASDIGWMKPKSEPATLIFSSSRQADKTVLDKVQLTGKNLNVKGSANLAPGGGLESVALNDVSFGKTKLSTFEYASGANSYKMTAIGDALDISGFLMKKGGEFSFEKFPALDLKIDVKTLYMANGQQMRPVKGTMNCTQKRCTQASISGKLGGDKAVSFAIAPHDGVRKLTIKSADAGALLRAIDTTNAMSQGVLLVTGQFDETGALQGVVDVKDYTLKDAPILAKLLSLASLTGFFDTLTGQGIGFKKLNIPFTLENDVVTIKDAKTYGPAIGLTVR